MTINTRKHTSSIHQVEAETIGLKQNTKSILRVISRSCTLLFILMALCGLTMAQSTDPANPTPITSNKVQGFASKAGATYYYRFKAKKGSVTVTLKGWTNNYSTQFEADLLSSDGTDLGDIYVSASDTPSSASKDLSFESDQSVNIVVKLLKDENVSSKNYIITLAGAVDFGEQGGGNQDSSSAALPDLIVTDVQIGGDGGNNLTVFVSNVCNGDVTAKSIRIRLLVYNGPSETSKSAFQIEQGMARLAGNTSSKLTISLLPSEKLTSFKGRYIRVDVDPDNLIEEAIKTNNWFVIRPGLFGDSTKDYKESPFPSPTDSCKPKAP